MDNTNGPPTSEMGFASPTDKTPGQYMAALEAQNRTLMELLKSMQTPRTSAADDKATHVALPKFNPDGAGADASAWCTTVDLIFADHVLEGSGLVMTLSKALEGSASQWLSQVCFAGITWTQFKELFNQRFVGVETTTAILLNVLDGRPKSGEGFAEYGSRIDTSLMSKWKAIDVEEIAVSVALAHMAQIDNSLLRWVYTTNVTSRNELQQQLQAHAFKKRNAEENASSTGPERKKIKFQVKCHHCGKIGHKIAECRNRLERTGHNARGNNQNGSSDFGVKNRINIRCVHCNEKGHYANSCPKIKTSENEKKKMYEKRVDFCTVAPPKGNINVSGELIPFCFDSGAECSLVKESVAEKFKGKRLNNIVKLNGIGNDSICSTMQILSNINVEQYCLEILLHVVMDKYLKYDVLIGREILSQGFSVTIAAEKFSIDKTKRVDVVTFATYDNVVDSDGDLSNSDKMALKNILKRYSDWFIDGIPQTRVTTGNLEIRLIDPLKTVQRRPYRLSEDEKEHVRYKIDELLKFNIIRPSCSPFASPMMLVKKKNGSDRLCVDFRALNENTVADKYPLPLISDQIARLRGASYFSSLDMASGFYQIPVHPDSIERTAFVTPEGQYEFLTMPFGLKNAPSVFQRAINKALGNLAHTYAIVYIDDVLVVAETKDEALDRLQIVLETLSKAGFSFNVTKCSFLKTRVEYLGFEVSNGQVRPNPRKIQVLTDLPPPKSVTQLRLFIGLASYFRQFVPKFSETLKLLYALTSRKNSDFVWQIEHEKIRTKIISFLTQEPVLRIFDPQHSIELHTDASSIGYGAILLHRIDKSPMLLNILVNAHHLLNQNTTLTNLRLWQLSMPLNISVIIYRGENL
ncbi:uncharacterized protein LOC122320104 [Drosophila ficusphila]|uniref:uncharacterized protein LOC122320104 n=1 Tax=Drosophila ficusphila TaxID=30025 RepID=UPI001C8A9921|nr:uncharacterized protein LOC122320104 [Drosophila ficusphila]